MRPSSFRVLVNGVIRCNEPRFARRTWSSVEVFVGDPWHTPAPFTTVSNFYVLEALPDEQQFIGSVLPRLSAVAIGSAFINVGLMQR